MNFVHPPSSFSNLLRGCKALNLLTVEIDESIILILSSSCTMVKQYRNHRDPHCRSNAIMKVSKSLGWGGSLDPSNAEKQAAEYELATRRAVMLAISSTEDKLAKCKGSLRQTCRLSDDLAQFQSIMLKTQRSFQGWFRKLSLIERVDVIFDVFDRNKSGSIDTKELAIALRKLDSAHQQTMTESIEAAKMSIAAFDFNRDG